jgi:hypothetical protein
MVAETKLYDALGISSSAKQEDIKKAYRYVYFSFLFFFPFFLEICQIFVLTILFHIGKLH